MIFSTGARRALASSLFLVAFASAAEAQQRYPLTPILLTGEVTPTATAINVSSSTNYGYSIQNNIIQANFVNYDAVAANTESVASSFTVPVMEGQVPCTVLGVAAVDPITQNPMHWAVDGTASMLDVNFAGDSQLSAEINYTGGIGPSGLVTAWAGIEVGGVGTTIQEELLIPFQSQSVNSTAVIPPGGFSVGAFAGPGGLLVAQVNATYQIWLDRNGDGQIDPAAGDRLAQLLGGGQATGSLGPGTSSNQNLITVLTPKARYIVRVLHDSAGRTRDVIGGCGTFDLVSNSFSDRVSLQILFND